MYAMWHVPQLHDPTVATRRAQDCLSIHHTLIAARSNNGNRTGRQVIMCPRVISPTLPPSAVPYTFRQLYK